MTSIGIVYDSDDNPETAFQSVCTAIEKVGWIVPKQPLMPAGQNPKVTVMILPDANTTGMLEDVCLASVSENPAIKCVDVFFECIRQETSVFSKNLSKARVHAFLASRPEPDLRFGEATLRGYWDLESEAFNSIKNFLRMLVED